jgi:Domain of unknown function (DUF4386)
MGLPLRPGVDAATVAEMSTETAAGVLLVVAPVWFNATFTTLAMRFDYPEILRRPTPEILSRFQAGGPLLIMVWWGFTTSGLLLIATAVVLAQALGSSQLLPLAVTIGVLAGLVQMLGLLRWVYLVPPLANAYADPSVAPEERAAILVTFRALHQYLGVGLGEHLGYLLTGLWSLLIGIVLLPGGALPSWLGWPGIVIGAGLILGSGEFLGPYHREGWPLAGKAVPILYIAWSLWLLAMGVTLLV